MRTFLSRTAGAVFNEEMPGVTFSVKKSWIEIIFKIEPHIYTIINMVAAGDDKAFLFTNWTDFLYRIENKDDTMEKVKKNCPSVYSAYQADSPDGIRAQAIQRDNGFRAGYVKEVDIKKYWCPLKVFGRLLGYKKNQAEFRAWNPAFLGYLCLC